MYSRVLRSAAGCTRGPHGAAFHSWIFGFYGPGAQLTGAGVRVKTESITARYGVEWSRLAHALRDGCRFPDQTPL